MWRPFAENGNLDAMFNIGQAHKLGRGLPKSDAQASDWYRKAAERGHRPAQANLGILLFQAGQKADALRWLKQAADAGEPRAQYVYGVAHWNGDGVPRSLVTAYAYLARAADQGLAEGRSAIDLLTPKMSVVERTSGWQLASALAKSDGSSGPLASIPPPVALADAAPVPQTPSSNPAAMAGTKPAPPRTRAAYRVQLGAYSRRELAEAALVAVRARSPALLEGVAPILQYEGALTRLQLGTFGSPEESKAACARFVAAGYSCIPVDAP
jgi:TPR repeat protein